MRLADLIRALPDEALVPVGWIREHMPGDADALEPTTSVDLTVEQLAARLGRAPSTMRSWLAAGRFDGAYRLRGREWRVPPAALAAFQRAESARHQATPPMRAGAEVRTDAWRDHLPKAS